MSSASSTATGAATSSSAASGSFSAGGGSLKIVGIILAISSGLLIGSSFVFKKKGLLRSQAGQAAGEGVAYLKSPLWWLGMSMMILGELCNFAAYAFVEALVVTPLGALSVVICAILSSLFLNEKLTFFGWLGCALCIIGSVIIALNGPEEATVGHIKDFQKLFLAPGFLAYISVLIGLSLVIVFYFAPRYGKKSMLWYIAVCSMIGGISVSVTTGLGAAIVTTAQGENQFKFWFMYFLLAFVAITLITEVYYLNVALALFNTAMVTPTYYVIFTFFSMVTTIILFKGLKASVAEIITLVMGFLVICLGITILQMSKVDPRQLEKLDRRSTMLLQAARSNTEAVDEKDALGVEDPGMDALRGSFGTVGSIIRARSARRMSQSSRTTSYRSRPPGAMPPYSPGTWNHEDGSPSEGHLNGMKRHQLWDAPMPDLTKSPSQGGSPLPQHRTTIKFDSHDLVHKYHRPGTGGDGAIHQQRTNSYLNASESGARNNSTLRGMPYPPGGTSSSRGSAGGLTDLATDGGGSTRQYSLNGSAAFRDAIPPPSLLLDHSEISDSGVAGLGSGRNISTAPETIRTAPPTSLPNKLQLDLEELGLSRRILNDGSPASASLLSFPSVTDSAPSQGSPYNTPGARKAVSPGGKKRYPKGSEDDDREESIGLFRREDSVDFEDESGTSGDDDRVRGRAGSTTPGPRLTSSPPPTLEDPPPGGIRLVRQPFGQSGRGDGRF